MQKVFRKRMLRELAANPLRYLALGLLVALGMYLIVSLVGAAETVIIGVGRSAEESFLEDGQFSVFVPLTQEEEKNLTDKGITLERMFYMDYPVSEGTLRVFRNRQEINLTNLQEGRAAATDREAVLEKRYCEEHGITTGDRIVIADQEFTVTGIGTVPDYDSILRSLSDSSVDSRQFGLAFVTEEGYEAIKKTGETEKAEENLYAYRLNGRVREEEIKAVLEDTHIEIEAVEDPFFRQYWQQETGDREEVTEGIEKLSDAAKSLTEGLDEINTHSDELVKGAQGIFEANLEEINDRFASYGLQIGVTKETYEAVIAETIASGISPGLSAMLTSTLEKLKLLDTYAEGISAYTGGTGEALDGAGELQKGIQELQERTDKLMEEYFNTDIPNLTMFLPAEDNPRINASANDMQINKTAGLIAGAIVMLLFTYVISVFVVHGIERETGCIGALYAMGVRKTDLLVHYLLLPVMITAAAGIIGTIAGFSSFGMALQLENSYGYFSIPILQTEYPFYLIAYGILLPPVAAAVVNCLVIRKKLGKPALQMIRGEQKSSSAGRIDLKNMGFIGRFRIRHMLREMRTGAAVVLGMFVAMLIMMLGIDCFVMCRNLETENEADIRYGYMYTYKYPEAAVPDGGEPAYAKSLKKELYGYDLDITLLGIEPDNPYFDIQAGERKVEKTIISTLHRGSDSRLEESGRESHGYKVERNFQPYVFEPIPTWEKPKRERQGYKNEVIISSALAQKYGLDTEDKLILTDKDAEMDYVFTVRGITQYSVGLYAFMDISGMRELFGVDKEYVNVVFSKERLNIPAGRLYAATAKADVVKASAIFIEQMRPLIVMLVSVSVLIFCVVMYLMMKVMIDRSAYHISLIKIFGYREKEVRKLYLDGNFYIIAIGAAVCIPLSKKVVDGLYPMLVANVGCAMNLTFSWQLYAGIYASVLALYLLINQLLLVKVKKMLPAEVLKNRE